ncbi:hypothetical protein LUZ60_001087 [Juncus effusus]|nr:hypothetical protein LUZ60_001087 [Juncus effusus]
MRFLIPLLFLSLQLTTFALPEKGIGPVVQQSAWLSHVRKPNRVNARAFLDAHNAIRVNYGSRPLRWNKKMARFARRWSYKMHSVCNLTHSHGPYGENLFIGGGPWTIKQAMDYWADEVKFYNWMSNTCTPGKMCGHFTQMIWEETRAVGCGAARCNETHIFMTCNYEPAGNYVGRRPIRNYHRFMPSIIE